MTTIELPDDKVAQLLNVLDNNKSAVSKGAGVRWTPQAAEEIAEIRDEIAEQTEVGQ